MRLPPFLTNLSARRIKSPLLIICLLKKHLIIYKLGGLYDNSYQLDKPNALIEVYFISRVDKEDINGTDKLLKLIPDNVFIQSKYGSVTVNKRLSHA